MHVEKDGFESTISLLLDIPSKTKDGLSARKDLQALEIKEELHPQERPNGKTYLPPASYTLTTFRKSQDEISFKGEDYNTPFYGAPNHLH
jgi:hypothetical protein